MYSELNNYVTMADIVSVIPVTERTVRSWISEGLLPRPLKTSEGYRKGVVGYYPKEALNTARVLHAARGLTLQERSQLVGNSKRYTYIVEEDGTVVVRMKAKTAFNRGNDD